MDRAECFHRDPFADVEGNGDKYGQVEGDNSYAGPKRTVGRDKRDEDLCKAQGFYFFNQQDQYMLDQEANTEE